MTALEIIRWLFDMGVLDASARRLDNNAYLLELRDDDCLQFEDHHRTVQIRFQVLGGAWTRRGGVGWNVFLVRPYGLEGLS